MGKWRRMVIVLTFAPESYVTQSRLNSLGVCNMLLVGDADLYMLAIGIAGHLEMNNSVFVRWK